MDSDLLIRTGTCGSVRQELSQGEKKGLMKDAVMKIRSRRRASEIGKQL
jgi:hypothetical protein